MASRCVPRKKDLLQKRDSYLADLKASENIPLELQEDNISYSSNTVEIDSTLEAPTNPMLELMREFKGGE